MIVSRKSMHSFKNAYEHLQMEEKCIPNVNWVVSLYVSLANKSPCVVCDFMKLMIKPINDINDDEGWSSDYFNFLIHNGSFDNRAEKNGEILMLLVGLASFWVPAELCQ